MNPSAPYRSPVSLRDSAQDIQHLDLLSIFHFVYAAMLGVITLGAGVFLVGAFAAIGLASASQGERSGALAFGLVTILSGVVLLLLLAKAGLLVYSGVCLRRRRHRTLSMVTACLTCMSVPVGTALGIFTLLVLSRPSVRALYGDGSRHGLS